LNGFTSCSKPGKIAVVFISRFLSNGLNVGGEIRAVFAARVFGMGSKRRARSARMLPDAATLIPVEAKTGKRVCGGAMTLGRKLQPNPFADNLGQFILAGQLRFQ